MSKNEKKELREALLQAEKIAVRGINDAEKAVVQGIKDVHQITTSAIKDETTTQVK
jgi:hypothetical protein